MNDQLHKWIIKRFFSIMVSYWAVIIPVIILNGVIQYKKTTLFMDFITLFGRNLFLKDPIYVIAWYSSFILILYLFLYVQVIVDFQKIFIGLISFIFIWYFLDKEFYFISFAFAFGCFLFQKICLLFEAISFNSVVSLTLFKLNKYYYPFFLVHGGVLIFFSFVLKVLVFTAAVLGILFSFFLSVLVVKIKKFLIAKITKNSYFLTTFSIINY